MSITDHFKNITLTDGQSTAVQKIAGFLQGDKDIFILKGYAGTGKTTLLKGIVQYLNTNGFINEFNLDNEELTVVKTYQIMAPTGRAAKILTDKTGFNATTIHKAIYNFSDLKTEEDPDHPDANDSFKYYFELSSIRSESPVIIVDEASMVSDRFDEDAFFRFGSGYLLTDLINYAGFYQAEVCPKIIFVGDSAQLPPVNMNISPALNVEYLQNKFNLKIESYELTEVVRQSNESTILQKATQIRKNLIPYHFKVFDVKPNQKDILEFNKDNFWQFYQALDSGKIIITYKNKTAYQINQYIRKHRFGYQNNQDFPIQKGDIILIGTNNYLYGVMNGEFGVVLEVSDIIKQEGVKFNKKGGTKGYEILQWRKVTLLMDNGHKVRGYMLENFLTFEGSSLTPDQKQALFVEFVNRNEDIKKGSEEFKKALKDDHFFNALQLKYGYAVTCHKAQGGEWHNAFVFFKDFSQNYKSQTFYRWAYTAMTRAKQTLMVNNPPYFHSFLDITFVSTQILNTYNNLQNQTTREFIRFLPEHREILNNFGVSNYSKKLQYHFIKVYELLKRIHINLKYYDVINYEIRYGFRKRDQKVLLKFWRNANDDIRNNFQKIPGHTNSEELYQIISLQLQKLPNTILDVEMTESSDKMHQDYQIEEIIAIEKPVLKTLFENLRELTGPFNIKITKIEHLTFIERYHFKRDEEQAVLDFNYNSKVFFSTVTPLEQYCNSQEILNHLEQIIEKLKQ